MNSAISYLLLKKPAASLGDPELMTSSNLSPPVISAPHLVPRRRICSWDLISNSNQLLGCGHGSQLLWISIKNMLPLQDWLGMKLTHGRC